MSEVHIVVWFGFVSIIVSLIVGYRLGKGSDRKMKMLRLGKAVLYLKMKDGETQEDAVERLFDIIEDTDIEISVWSEEGVKEYDDETG